MPLPLGLVSAIHNKRAGIKSADYTVEYISPANNNTDLHGTTCRFCFHGDDLWYADISSTMGTKKFITGSDGKNDWSLIENQQGIFCRTRPLSKISEKHVKLLDPLACVGVAKDKLEAHLATQGIFYMGKESFQGEQWYIFRRVDGGRNGIIYEAWIHADTLLPQFGVMFRERDSKFVEWTRCCRFNINSLNEALPDASFTPVFPEGAVPEVKTEPDEGYNRFYVVINDGADGRMCIRVNGQKGAKGTMSSGLN